MDAKLGTDVSSLPRSRRSSQHTSDESSWRYDEFRQVGTDFAAPEVARSYDRDVARAGRDVRADGEHVIQALGLERRHEVVELGCGTGSFALQAARRCGHLHAVDVSKAMLAVAGERLDRAGIRNVTLHHGGFLDFTPRAPVDAVVTQYALHHLPDFWKLVALQNVRSMLKPKGGLFVRDFVYSFDTTSHEQFFSGYIAGLDPQDARRAAAHVREEQSTMDWVMEGLLTRAGFDIVDRDYRRGILAWYWCRRSA